MLGPGIAVDAGAQWARERAGFGSALTSSALGPAGPAGIPATAPIAITVR